MKRQYFLLLLIIICISLTGCGKKETTQIEAESAKKELKQQDQYSVYHLASTIDLSNTQETYKAQNEFSTCIMGQDGKLQLAFYMDKETGKGYGWKYGEFVDNGKFPFVCDGYATTFRWNYPNPYSTDVTYDGAAVLETNEIPDCMKQEFDSYDYNYNYDLEGRLSSYTLIGHRKDRDGNAAGEEIYKVSFLYREQGTLWKKEYWYNENLFDNYGARSQYYLYDELERLQYIRLNNKRDQWEDYYFCYEEESMIPFSCLTLMEHIVAVYEIIDNCDRWAAIPKNGVDAFLRQAGLPKQEVFYRYQWHNSDTNGVIWQHSDVNLTLYYNKEKEIGCGLLEYPAESINMDGFLFTECIKVDCSKTNPNEAYDYYSDGEEVYCYPMEKLTAAYCDYRGDKLLRSILLGNTEIERFYIYNEDNTLPLYCLNLIYGSHCSVALIQFNWQ